MSDHYADGAAPSAEDFVATLRDVVLALRGDGVEHLFMGGIGTYSHARPRVTDDIDLFIRPGDLQRTLSALDGAGFATEVHDPSWLGKAFKRDVLVDVIFRSAGDIYVDDEMLRRGRSGEYQGITAPVIAPEDLLVIKGMAAGEAVPHHWYDALGIIARCDLDWDYLLERACRSGARRILSLLLYAESSDLIVPPRIVGALFEAIHPASTSEATHD